MNADPKGGMPSDRPSVVAGSSGGRRRPLLNSEGRVPTDPMNSPLNPEREPAPFAAVRS